MRFSLLSCRMEERAPHGASEKVRSPFTMHSQTVPGGTPSWAAGCTVGGAWIGAGGAVVAGVATLVALGVGALGVLEPGVLVATITVATAAVVMSTPLRIHGKRSASVSFAIPHSKAKRGRQRTSSLSEMPQRSKSCSW